MLSWILVGRILAFFVLVMYSISIGLIDNGILRSENCCGEDEMCWEVLYLEGEAFYDGAVGLRTRYVLFVVFLFLSSLLRWLESDFVRPVVMYAMFVATFIVALLTGDSSIRSFGNSPLTATENVDLINTYGRFSVSNCIVEPGTIELNVICSWLGLLGSCCLFFLSSLLLPKDGLWERGTLNLGYIQDVHALGEKFDPDGEEDIV